MDESLGWLPDSGWKEIETQVDRIDGLVRITMSDQETGRTLYSFRYAPETARMLAQMLTMNSIMIEDES